MQVVPVLFQHNAKYDLVFHLLQNCYLHIFILDLSMQMGPPGLSESSMTNIIEYNNGTQPQDMLLDRREQIDRRKAAEILNT